MANITRVGVTFPPALLEDFDEIISRMGYESRSKAIQDAVTLFVSERKWIQEEENNQTGILLMVYDHEVRGLENELTEAQTTILRSSLPPCTYTLAKETV